MMAHPVRTAGVPVAIMQQALENSGLSKNAAALCVGLVRRPSHVGAGVGDTARLKRKIGLLPQSKSGRYLELSDPEWCARAIIAWGLDPVDYDL